MPNRPWIMRQTWHDLLFAHWPARSSQLRSQVPAAFDLDLFDGDAWIGIVPFQMTNVAPRGVPSLPWLSRFPELNVRTYVRVGNRPGVYFFSLDAGNPLAVRVARAVFNLPYHTASMTVIPVGDGIAFQSARLADRTTRLTATYQPSGPAFAPVQGSLEYFLTERYCLYNVDRRGVPYRLDIHHPPWPLQPATATIDRNTMAGANHLQLSDTAPLLHFARRQDMVGWGPAALA